ncbi:MAG: hypothetical protein MHMPM18_000195 [Marteilia pararefringens]
MKTAICVDNILSVYDDHLEDIQDLMLDQEFFIHKARKSNFLTSFFGRNMSIYYKFIDLMTSLDKYRVSKSLEDRFELKKHYQTFMSKAYEKTVLSAREKCERFQKHSKNLDIEDAINSLKQIIRLHNLFLNDGEGKFEGKQIGNWTCLL